MQNIQKIRQQYPMYDDMSDEQLADALYQKHYSDMPRDTFNEKIGLAAVKPIEQQPQEARWDHKVGATIDGIAQGLTFGFSDEIAAGMASGGGLWGDYDEALEEERARMAENKELAGGYELAGQLAGGVTNAAGLMKSGVTMLAKNPTVKKAALEGSLYGAAHGAGSSEEGQRIEGATKGALMGAATGGALQKGANVIKSKMANRAAEKAAPTVDDLKGESQALYAKMRDSGVVVREGKINNIKGNIAMSLGETSPTLAPQAHALKKLVDDTLQGDVNIIDLHNISKSVNRVSRAGLQGEDAYFVGKIKTFVDNAIDNMKSSDIKGPIEAVKLKGQADELWKTARKSEIIDGIFEKAQNQATGFENGLVIQFRSLANNKKLMKQFSPEEQKMIKDLVRRGSAREILKGIGMLSPTSTFGGLVTGGVGVGSGILPAAGMAAVGHGSRKAAEAITRNKANAIRNSVLTGQAPRQELSQRAKYLIAPMAQQSVNQTTTTNSRTPKRPIRGARPRQR